MKIEKKVYHCDFNRKRIFGNWNSDIYKVFSSLNKLDIYENMDEVGFTSAKTDLYEIEKNNWKNNILTISKLRTYTFKENYEIEPFVYKVQIRAHRSLLSKFRCRIFPLKIETGRYSQIPLEFRLCILCDSNLVENENHFLFHYHFYHTLMDNVFKKLKIDTQNLMY